MYMNYMNKKLRAIHLLATLVGVCFCSSVAAVTLDSIKTSSMPGERVQIKLELSEALSSNILSTNVDISEVLSFFAMFDHESLTQ